MKNEYYIKKLWFTGPGIEDSPVEFINGLNIIHGANDTGKSWILDSFDFMCGLDHEKFVIDKSTGCDTVHLEVETGHGTVTMTRQLESTKIDVESTDPRIDNKKRVANNGIVPQYYVENSHPAIIPREKFMKVREEMYRRAHMECGPDQKRRIYSSRYALSSIVYCAHCNDIFRRINWNNRGCKSTVWRCLSRVEKDRPSCTARTVKEELLHEVVVRAVNEVITGSSSFIPALQASFERCLGDSNSAAVEGIDAHLLELQQELLKLANAKQNYETLADEIDELRAEKEELLLQEANKEGIRQRIADMMAYLQSEPEEVTEYSEALVRRMIEKITVYDDHFVVEFKSGIEITINE